MRTTIVSLGLAFLSLAGAFIATVSQDVRHASAASAPYTAFYMDSEGEYIGQGKTWSYSLNDANFTRGGDTNHVTFSVWGDTWWHLNFQAPSGQPLAAGVYEDAQRWPFQNPTKPGLDVSGDGRGCNQLSGRFVVHEISFSPSGLVEKFAVSFEQHCEFAGAALFGEFRYNSAVPHVALDVPCCFGFGPQVIGEESAVKDLVITNTGTADLDLDVNGVVGVNASDFTIVADGCTNGIVAPGGECAISMTFTPAGGGTRLATLLLGNNSFRGERTIAISGTGATPKISLYPTYLYFEDTRVGAESQPRTLSLTNVGDAPLVISGLSFSGDGAADYHATLLCAGPIGPGSTCSIEAVFAPTSPGDRDAVLEIQSNAEGSPHEVDLYGQAYAVADLVVSMGAFPDRVRTSTVITYSITVRNAGPNTAYAVDLIDVLPSGSEYAGLSMSGAACSAPAFGETGTLSCSLGDLAPGTVWRGWLYLRVTLPGKNSLFNTVTADSLSYDLFTSNNSATVAAFTFGRR